MRPLAAREALARRVPLPGLRARQGLGAGPRAVDPAVRGLRAAGLGHRRDGAPRQPPRPAHLVPGRLADGDAQERHLRPAAVAATRTGQLQVGLAAGAQAAPGDGRPGTGGARRPGRGGRDLAPLSRQRRARPARTRARGQAAPRRRGRDQRQGAGPDPARGDRRLLGRRARRLRRRRDRRRQHGGE